MKVAKNTIAVIGAVSKDIIIQKQFGKTNIQTGGAVYYTSQTFAALDTHVTAIPMLSKKDSSLLDAFNTPLIQLQPFWSKHSTSFELLYPDEMLNRREIFLKETAGSFTYIEDIFTSLSSYSVVHLGPLNSDEMPVSFVKKIREKTLGILSLDAQGIIRQVDNEKIRHQCPQDIREYLQCIDVLKVDRDEAAIITGEEDPYKAIEVLIPFGIKEILVTMENRGSLVYGNGKFFSIKAVQPKKVVDTTGCGDTYTASFLAHRFQGFDIEESANFASLISSKKVETLGPVKRERVLKSLPLRRGFIENQNAAASL